MIRLFPYVILPVPASAGYAIPTALRANVSVAGIVGMSVRAMLLKDGSLPRMATEAIDGVRDYLKMIRIHAASHSAKMIQFKSFWDCFPSKFVQNAMHSVGMPSSISETNASVSLFVDPSHPNPASGFRDHLNVTHTTLKYSGVGHVTPFSRIGRGRCDAPTSRGPVAMLSRSEAA